MMKGFPFTANSKSLKILLSLCVITTLFTTTTLQNNYIFASEKNNLIPYSSLAPKKSYILNSGSALILWSSDFHISPIADAKWILNSFSTKVIDKSLSSHCHLTNTCQLDLRIINQENGITLGDCPNNLRRSFYQSYRQDEEFLSSDIVLCTHAASMCELFMPFNKSLAVIASTRYEIGRHGADRWSEWNRNLERIASKPQNLIAANNRFDQEYIRYFTGIDKVEYLPNICGYISARYSPNVSIHPEVLVAPARGVNEIIMAQLFHHLRQYHLVEKEKSPIQRKGQPETTSRLRQYPISKAVTLSRPNLTFAPIRDLYPHFEYADLANHPAIVVLPYQVSFMSFFEFYRMEIPLFVPSVALLTEWQIKYNILHEKSWNSVFGRKHLRHSAIPKSLHSKSAMKHDPNNDADRSALLEWLPLSDFYTFPHVTTFDSWENLFDLVSSIDLRNISYHMHLYNEELKSSVTEKWRKFTNRVFASKKSSQVAGKRRSLPKTLDEALMLSYGVTLSDSCAGDSEMRT